MATASKYINSKTTIKNNPKPQSIIKCYQINLQHSKTATDNLMELIEKEGKDVAFIQEPYTTHNRVAGITKRYRTFTSWQNQWKETTKGAVTKEFFPSVEGRLAVNIQLNPNVKQ
jgi:hypothetical protein